MRQEDSILLLCTEADAANTSIQKWQKCDSSNFISDPCLFPSLALLSGTSKFLYYYPYDNSKGSGSPQPHITYVTSPGEIGESCALPTESISSSRWRSLMLRISLRERRSNSSRGRGESCGGNSQPVSRSKDVPLHIDVSNTHIIGAFIICLLQLFVCCV